MSHSPIHLTVYGTAIQCASCVNAPSSQDTYEWLQAALNRKFPHQTIHYHYIDIAHPPLSEEDARIIEKIEEDEYFYPLVLVNQQVVGEGFIQLKPVVEQIQKVLMN